MQKLRNIAALLIVLTLSVPTAAFETDQYNLPSEQLADIGDEVTEYVRENVEKALAKVNLKIKPLQDCLDKPSKGCGSAGKIREKLVELRSEETIAREIFKLLGGGIPPYTASGTWMEKHKFSAAPARFKMSYRKSIYRKSPINYFSISETVRIYGFEFGTDKIAHIFQQGYTYYRIFMRQRAKDVAVSDALRKAVNWGKMTEKTYYGFLISGVYSNGDLAANYAGMKFYERLTRETKIGDAVFAPLLSVKNGLWQFNGTPEKLRETLLKPYITDHLNEALNPSVYASFLRLRSTVRKTVKDQACDQWRKAFPQYSAEHYAKLADTLKLWYGEDYGFRDSSNRITIAETCF